MSPLHRLFLCVIVPTVVGICVAPSAGAAYLPGCGGPGESALNQYCESTPTAQGPLRPGPGEPALGQAAPPALVTAIRRAIHTPAALRRRGPRIRRLLALPARTPAGHDVAPTLATHSGAGPSVYYLVILILGSTLLAAVAGVVVRRGESAGTPG